MIRDQQRSVPRPQRPRGQEPAPGLNTRSDRGQRPRDDGTPAETGTPLPADAFAAYGPDDPGYGPPGPDWYAQRESARRREAEDELRQARGAFEPLPPDHVVPEAPVFDSDYEARVTRPLDVPTADLPAAAAEAEPEVDIARAGRGEGPPLERIKDLYATAEAVGDSRLDEHFEQLLARQRQLIREYFTESDSRTPPRTGRGIRATGHRDGAEQPERADLSLGGARRGRP